MSVVGLFAGIGGFELAFARAGLTTEMIVELDPGAHAVLRSRFPHADLRTDVLDVDRLPQSTTILTAGFPCQNLSMAGDKSGIRGTKSGIVSKMFQLIDGCDVPNVVLENVYFMLQLDRGSAMRWLVDQFEARGFRWAYRVLDTIGFGLPQRRRRVYLIASRVVDPRRVLFADGGQPIPQNEPTLDRPLGFYWTEGRSGIGLTVDGIPPLKVGSTIGIPSAPAVLFPDGAVLMPSIEACEQLQGFQEGWTDVGSLHDVERGQRWRMIGNAVSVPVAEWVARRLQAPGDVQHFETAELSSTERWPTAAWNVEGVRTRVVCSEVPIYEASPSIAQFRDPRWTELSTRAMNGFIARAGAGNLRMPSGFLDALRNAATRAPRGRVATVHETHPSEP
jgi:DNA (cytosine-5)-methyltransferase 1